MASSEPFPLLNTSADQLHSRAGENGSASAARRRRKSSMADELSGDTGAPGLATSLAHMSAAHRGHHHHHHAKDGKDSTNTLNAAANASSSKRFSKRRKARSVLRRAKQFAMRHTWVLPLAILLVFLALYAVDPSPANPISHFLFLSYRMAPAPGAAPDTPAQYGKGLWDVAFVTFYVVVLSFTREFIMQEILRPMGRAAGLRSRGKQARFAEQMYTALYFGVLGPAGMWVMSRSPVWYFSTRGMYEGFPHRTHAAEFKFYYLFQAAYWAQQAVVLLLGMEKPRKDFKELVGHHIVSLALIGLSYRFHFTHMGLAVYITHDVSDFFLATSKTLNYIDSAAQGPYYFFFMCVWIYMRHYLNLRILWSILTEFRTVGPYELDWATEQYKCWISAIITFALLAALQALNIFWLFFILRIAYRFVVHRAASDDRSDNEASGDEADADAADAAEPRKPRALHEDAHHDEHDALLAPAANGLNGAATNGSAMNGKPKTRAR